MKPQVTPFELTLRAPVQTAQGAMRVRRGFVVRFPGGGAGEATPLEEFGTESLEQCQQALERFELRTDAPSLEAVDAALQGLDETPAARAGLELALLDRLAIRRGVPLVELLGGSAQATLSCGALLAGETADALLRNATALVEQGFRTLKVKIGRRPLIQEAQRLLAIRRAVGSGVRLRVDANGTCTEGEARTALRAVESLNLELCEQPVAAGDLEGLSRLRGYVPCLIAVDEGLLVPGQRPRLFDVDRPRVADVAVLKPMALGGLRRAQALAAALAERAVDSYVTTLLDGPIARAGAAADAAAIQATALAHGLSTVELFEGLPPDAYTPQRGTIHLPRVAGHGVTWAV